MFVKLVTHKSCIATITSLAGIIKFRLFTFFDQCLAFALLSVGICMVYFYRNNDS